MSINSVPDVKCFYNNKNVLHAQSMVLHFVRHPVAMYLYLSASFVIEVCSQLIHFLENAFILKHMQLVFLKNASIFARHKSFHISNNFPSVITIHLETQMASSSGL